MSRSIVWKEQTRFIEDAVESWKQAHEEAMHALELDTVLRVCVVLGDYVRDLVAATWEELFSGKLIGVQERGASFQRAFDQSAEAFAELAIIAREFVESGHELPHYASFVAAHDQLLRLKEDFESRWPRFNAEALESKLAGPAEFVDPEEIYREFPELRPADQGAA
jgi:hypothetical protein